MKLTVNNLRTGKSVERVFLPRYLGASVRLHVSRLFGHGVARTLLRDGEAVSPAANGRPAFHLHLN